MPEQNKTTETQDEKLRRQEIKQEADAREATRQAAFAASGGGPVGPPDDISIQAVAGRLGDTRFQTAQRQAMAARIRRVSGNKFLQRTVAEARRQREPVGDAWSAWRQQEAVERDAEGTPESTAAKPRAALRPVAGDAVSPAPVSTEPRFGHDTSRVPAHTVAPQAGEALIQRDDGPTGEIEMDRQQFINLCNQCDTKISRAYTRANSVMEVLSAAYGSAYQGHQDTLTAQSASNQLAERIILSAALAFIPGGVGGVVGNMMQNAAVGNFLAGALTDMAKAGVASVQTAVVPGGGGGGSPMRPMGANPRTWRAQYVVRVNTEKEHVLDILDNWKTKANASDPDFYLNFNPVTVTERSLVQNGQPLKDMPVPDQAEHERLFELGFWRDWLQTFAYTVEATPSYRGVRYTTRENQGKKIRDRINALGENGDEWLERYGGVARRRAEAERERRNR